MKAPILSIALVLVAGLSGCSTSSHVIVGTPRAPISPDDVRVYASPPKEYDEIAWLQASSDGSWAVSDQGKTDVVIARLKAEAAQLGANGVLLQDIGDRRSASVRTGAATGVGFGRTTIGTGVSVPISGKGAGAVAIYVIDE